jgi:hypothetical protein
MIKLKEILMEGKVPKLSPQEVADKKLFGPMFHGTDSSKREKIETDGFKVFIGAGRGEDMSHGYQTSDYYGGTPAPIHHLGFGVYFTTNKSIAKQFNHGTMKGLKPYFTDASHMETINFGAPRTMMAWWLKNGYDYNPNKLPELYFGNEKTSVNLIGQERIRATTNLTNYLKARYDVVWYKGKSLYSMLDGDQVCVYDPSHIYEMDIKLSKSGERGGKVVAKVGIDPFGRGEITVPIGTKGIIISKEDAQSVRDQYPHAEWIGDAKTLYTIKWNKGGTMSRVLDTWIDVL